MTFVNDERWPELPEAWNPTYATLHMWTQVVGKIALAQAQPLNHSWGVALQVSSRGLMTRPLPYDQRTFTMEFDFVDHQLEIATSDGMIRSLPLVPRTVADFYAAVVDTLKAMDLPVRIWPVSVEIPNPIRLDQDTIHHSYDAEYANRFWRVIVQCERIFSAARCQFIGKASPVHFF